MKYQTWCYHWINEKLQIEAITSALFVESIPLERERTARQLAWLHNKGYSQRKITTQLKTGPHP